MRTARFIAGLSSIATGIGIPVLALLWVYASDYRRMRYEQLLHDPARIVGIGWKLQLPFVIALALVVGGVAIVYGALRTPSRTDE